MSNLDQYAVFGNPIAHSKSPIIHRMFAEQTRQSLEYRAILAPVDDFRSAVNTFVVANGKGFNVTVPFKQQAWTMVNTRSGLAQRAGAVNTVTIGKEGTLHGDNTDGIGIVRDLENNLGIAIQGKRVLILGAGGAVRGIIEPLAQQKPASIAIANRTAQKAVEIAQDFAEFGAIIGCGFEELSPAPFDIVINGTAASLQNDLPPIPSICVSNAACYDMMYGKDPTTFMQWAQQNGARSINDGLGMLVEQAAEAFFIWRNIRPQTQPVITSVREMLLKI